MHSMKTIGFGTVAALALCGSAAAQTQELYINTGGTIRVFQNGSHPHLLH